MTTSNDGKISADRRAALRGALAIGSGAAIASALISPASAQASADNTLDRIRAGKVLRIAVLPGELPYFNKDLATGSWSGMCIEMANDIAKLLDVKLEHTEFDLRQLDPRLAIEQDRPRLCPQPDAPAGVGGGFLRRGVSSSVWRHAAEGP